MTVVVSPLEIAVLERTVLPDRQPQVLAACPACGGQGCDKCSQTGLAEFCSADVGTNASISAGGDALGTASTEQPSRHCSGTCGVEQITQGGDRRNHPDEGKREGPGQNGDAGANTVLRACDLRGLARTEEEIEAQRVLICKLIDGTHPSSYERGFAEGAHALITWLLGETDDPPLDSYDVS
ncbi:MAG: hypothetical protein LLG20_27375 [Acidobacteriales bacterium]|nr:hypothetical protein [Terriglobales bacterium]